MIMRIIPARAGFTLLRREDIARIPDHPRSRGVYIMGGVGGARGLGSSPLARGLRPLYNEFCDALRIIPARAGFTDDVRPMG